MPRKIVLLSDGTGNSSAKVWRTNVWRLFSALDLTSDEQVACYDDGVGTSSFKPLAILGGAFGIGLRRNVISLYKFSCRNFEDEKNEIFAFGFSRGAFTIRVTIGLILDQGLVDAQSITESQLDKAARRAYRAYHRKHFHTNWGLGWKLIKRLLGKTDNSAMPDGRRECVIRFLGLWDTVAAYGLPVDEMTRGVSQWIWPLEIPSHKLDEKVKRACHALSLDDERTTFHPVLWDESQIAPLTAYPRYTHEETISQVWFAGVHANVGGGYPDDSLAHIPLYWIMQEAKACGLKFKSANPDAIGEVQQAQDKDGRLYDSRAGLGSYYRYGPRRLSRLCDQTFSLTTSDRVYVAKPKIHESVFRRVDNHAQVYAPIGIPHDYEVVVTERQPNGTDAVFRIDPLPDGKDARLVDPWLSDDRRQRIQDKHESQPDRIQVPLHERAGDAAARVIGERTTIWWRVWMRAFLYFLTLMTTAFAVIFPFTQRSNNLSARQNELIWLSDIIRAAAGFLPSWASSWLSSYAEHPVIFLFLAGILIILLTASSLISVGIRDRMASHWKASLSNPDTAEATRTSNEWGRKDWIALLARWLWKDMLAPALSALLIVYAVVTLVNHWAFTALDDAGLICTATPAKDLKDFPDGGLIFSFDTKNPCFATRYKVGRLSRYYVWTMPEPDKLRNKHPDAKPSLTNTCVASADQRLTNGSVVADARGYETFYNEKDPQLSWPATLRHALLLPFRRYYGQPWLQPVARYGAIGNEVDFLQPDPDPNFKMISEYVTPKVPGELFFYFNDAVVAYPWGQPFYGDNEGCATFFVKPSK